MDNDDGFWDDYYAEHPIQRRVHRTDDFINDRGFGFWGLVFVIMLLCAAGLIVELAVPGGITEIIRQMSGSH